MPSPAHPLVALRGGGSSLVLSHRPAGLPEIVHWGADLGEADHLGGLLMAGDPPVPHSSLDDSWPLTLLPGEGDGWSGRPGLQAHRGGRAVIPGWSTTQVEAGQDRITVQAEDTDAGVALECTLTIDDQGVLTIRHEITNTGEGVLDIDELLAFVPLPATAEEVLDLTGRWCRERHPQRAALQHGGRVRESRRGRTGHDATLLLTVGEPGFSFTQGEVAAVHVAWSGDHVHLVDRLPEGAGRHTGLLGGGALLRAGEMRLDEGASYLTCPVLFVRSHEGLDGLSAALHDHVRARPAHPRTPRPVTVNTWEALYFDHDSERVNHLVDTAARIGAERVVLDDGWFTGRRDDSRGLGDWQVDPEVWPEGLGPLAERVHRHGMQMGLWVEPEMVNLDSTAARSHPEWLLAPDRAARGTRSWRAQQVLDLTHPGAFEHVLTHLDQVIDDVGIDHLKWDHNRDLHEAVDRDGRAAVREQTLAAYRLMSVLQERHPGLEIESCASGGARVDLGVLAHTHRVWASDCNDPLERQAIQRWTGLLLPPELIGTHVGPAEAHTTGRSTHLDFRCLTALFGHAGMELDIGKLGEEELARLTGWVRLHKRLRPLLHGGRTVRLDERDGAWLHGVVARDQAHAVYAFVRLVTGADARPGLVRLPGLKPQARYAVQAIDPAGRDQVSVRGQAIQQPAWCRTGIELSGAALALHGLTMPVLDPAAGLLLEVTEASG